MSLFRIFGKPAVSETGMSAEEQYYMAGQWTLVKRKFRKHKLAVFSFWVLLLLYVIAFTFEFWAPYGKLSEHDLFNAPPTKIHVVDEYGQLRRPFVYGLTQKLNMKTFKREMQEDPTQIYPIRFFCRGESYRFWSVFETNWHLFDAADGKIFLLGTDELGRDLFSRILAGSRISLTIGLVGVSISFIIGCLLGGISGYFGGWVDILIQRVIELVGSLPTTPLWMTLSAVIPPNWPVLKTYFMITVILSLLSWTNLARIVRGKLLELREQDYVKAAMLAGSGDFRIIFDHLLPGFMSYLIVNVTIAVPGMIISETALSFLGLGIRPPAVSWGTLLQGAQNVTNIAMRPWMLTPALWVIVTVLLFNFVGDGLRDAADPYK